MVRQQQRLKDIVGANIVPVMKGAGFKKTGNWFDREGLDFDCYLNVVSSVGNTGENVDFALGIHVMPSGKHPLYDRSVVSKRIFHLTGKSAWYNLTPEVNSKELGQEIEQDISQYVLPFFEGYK